MANTVSYDLITEIAFSELDAMMESVSRYPQLAEERHREASAISTMWYRCASAATGWKHENNPRFQADNEKMEAYVEKLCDIKLRAWGIRN